MDASRPSAGTSGLRSALETNGEMWCLFLILTNRRVMVWAHSIRCREQEILEHYDSLFSRICNLFVLSL